MIRKVVQYYQIFCNLSLDIVLGVWCNMLPLPYCFGFHPGIGWLLGLPAASWLVYLLDHILDSIRNPEVKSERHLFVRNNLKHMIAICLALLSLCVYLLFSFYSITLLATALTLSFFCCLYFILTGIQNPFFRYFYNKELMVACVYTSALYLPIGLGNPLQLVWVGYFASLLLISYLNLLIMSIIDLPADTRQQQFSWVMMIGRTRAIRLFGVLATATLGLSLFLCVSNTGSLSLLAACYAAMTASHALLFQYQHKFTDIRKWSEAIFWLPLLVWLLI